MDPTSEPGPPPTPVRSRAPWIAAIMLAAIAAFYLLREHWNHVAGNWVYLLLLLCPLTHLFGHRGHSHRRPDQ